MSDTPAQGSPGKATPLAGVAIRAIAARILDAVLHKGRSLKGEFAAQLPAVADVRDRALIEAMCFAALRQRGRYEAALASWLQKPLGPRESDLRALLYIGLAQLDAMQLPSHAAVSATVEAARSMGRQHQAGMVNALLRRAQREGVPSADPAAVWPQWLRQQIIGDWPAHAQAIFAASALAAPTWLRVNRQRNDVDGYQTLLREAGIESQRSGLLSDALQLQASIAVASLPGFAEGEVSVQDGSAQQAADAVQPPAAARVLDACAAPGGKSAHLLERDPGLQLLALDVDKRRLNRVQDTWQRLGVQGRMQAADASQPQSWWDGEAFQLILLDAPCSATGVVRRQPDVLLHRRADDIVTLVALQARLLDGLWTTLAPGGTLLYTTCSILKQENEQQIAAFLQRTPDAHAQPLDEQFGHASGAGRQRLPGEGDMDGFYYAAIRKQSVT
ncbi:16S rRNA (cytosine(967)-C(5))-methyltransferase RsmB [Pseudoxanthomonas dokdonensis]|uniref:16S rRNA (cytosine(967)-C(5))-methyltransferase n=1 Tax=Pseudoxanthomonas dokdonensis TaxID=344882 RepID=A0A0R0CHQ9_9GAMM|nr:16S rRNA (cytosine(967)-C(5))-methyltransferase RsmB [Pseudoxanthomonas dokdonensis]KRG69343.1 16S rRNA methyltransferase [Pseudoxanthomonas dokdonensis]